MAIQIWTGEGDGTSWNDALNWSSAIPVDGDDVYIESTSSAISEGLDQNSIMLASLNIAQNFTGSLGTFDTPLEIGAEAVSIGYSKGTAIPVGSGRVHLWLTAGSSGMGSDEAVVTVFNSKSTADDDGVMPIRIKADADSYRFFIKGGRVSLADQPGETSNFGDIDVSGFDSQVVIGYVASSDQSLGNLTVWGGSVRAYWGGSSLVVEGGVAYTEGTGTWSFVTTRGDGAVIGNSRGTVGALVVAGRADFTQSQHPRTVNEVTLYRGSTFLFDKTILTLTNAIAVGDMDSVEVSVT